MISGEEDREIFSDVASPDPLDEFLSWVGHPKSDAGDASPALSCYSSCGESDFERYCSANSFMGTASMCSSLGTCNDFLDSDLGSVRSLGVGEDRCIFENAGFGGRFPKNSTDRGCTDYSSDGRLEFCKVKNEIGNSVSAQEGRVVGFNKRSKSLPRHQENSSFDNNVENLTTLNFFNGSESLGNSAVNSMLNKADSGKDNAEGLVLSGDQGLLHSSVKHIPSKNIVSVQNNKKRLPHFGVLNASTVMQSGEDSPSNGASCREITKQGPDDMNRSHELNITSGISADGKEAGKLAEADEETSTGYEHTDDESSSMHYGSDDDQSIGPGDGINMAYYQKTKPDEENPLLINSTVAFGSDDWDNYESNLVNFTRGAGSVSPIFGGSEQVENVKEIHMNSCDVQAIYQSIENIDSCSVSSVYTLQDQSAQKASAGTDSNIVDGIAAVELRNAGNKEMSSLDKTEVSTGDFSGKPESNLKLNPFSDMAIRHRLSMAIKPPQDNVAGDLQNDVKDALPPVVQNDQETFLKRILTDSSMSKNPRKEYVAPNEAENLNVNEFYDDVVHEMEEILLDSEGSPGARFSKGNRASVSQPPKPFRDGSSTASTSGTNDACPQVSQPLKIDGIKVVGAKQKKGEVSLGERLVGVKEYTVYRLKVWSGKDQWEVERRYRDFVSLYRQLKTFFADNGQVLPSPWYEVEQESRKIFGNASPYVVRQRSALIQDSLRSILHCRLSFSTSSPMIWFLSPQNVPPSSSMLNSLVPLSSSAYHGETSMQGTSTLGKKISLIVQVPRRRSMKQLLEAQHYSCAGCHRYLNEGKTLLKEFVETFGWGKPRLCEYTGQLFCASCHTNDTAVLPARVLHFWDFTRYPVSQLAKSYLKSIYEQPMLCVSAVNPFLFSKVPALLHIMGIRKKIGAMLPYVRCPFRRSIHRGLGSRKYLIESNDFFALRDLVDLSKGPFAALPVMVENLCNKILEHITEQCLICCDVGVPCCAGQACEDPSSLIFPFQDQQEAKIKRCRSCESAFHKTCFRKLRSCRCGAELEVEHDGSSTHDVRSKASDEVDGALDLSAGKSNTGSTTRFLSGLFSRMGSEKTLLGRKDNNAVIVMGSFPPNYL